MNKHKVLIIAASTIRSFEYIKSIQGADIQIEKVIILDDGSFLPGQRDIDAGGSMFLKLKNFCIDHFIKVKVCPSDVNSYSVVSALTESNASLVVYSGYGGKIVENTILETGKSFLHIHSGLLPKYRGSTTIYYSILNNEKCGVTAILLDNGIDTGVIVGERVFELPQSDSDIDFNVDVKFRSKLLIDVLSYYAQHGEFMIKKPQKHKGNIYYVMHPILRHIAILKLK